MAAAVTVLPPAPTPAGGPTGDNDKNNDGTTLLHFRALAVHPCVQHKCRGTYVLRDFDTDVYPRDFQVMTQLVSLSAGFHVEHVVNRAMLVTSRVIYACLTSALESPIGMIILDNMTARQKGDIVWLYVTTKHRGEGVGRELLAAGLATVAQWGYDEVSAFRTLEAAPFFTRFGFTRADATKGFKHYSLRRLAPTPTRSLAAICAASIPPMVLDGTITFRLATEADRKAWNALVLDAARYQMGGNEMLQLTLDADLRLVAELAANHHPNSSGDADIVGLVSMNTSGWVPFICCGAAYRSQGLGSFLLALAIEWRRLFALQQPAPSRKPTTTARGANNTNHSNSSSSKVTSPIAATASSEAVAAGSKRDRRCRTTQAVAGAALDDSAASLVRWYGPDVTPDEDWPQVSLSPLSDRVRKFYERKGFVLEAGPLKAGVPFADNKLIMSRPVDPLLPILPPHPVSRSNCITCYVPQLSDPANALTREQKHIPSLQEELQKIAAIRKEASRRKNAAAKKTDATLSSQPSLEPKQLIVADAADGERSTTGSGATLLESLVKQHRAEAKSFTSVLAR